MIILLLTSVFLPISLYITQNLLRKRDSKTFLAIVLGDTGHSPRILSHCVAAKKYGYTGYLVGYNLSPIHSEASHIQIVNLVPYPKFLQSNLPKLVKVGVGMFFWSFPVNFWLVFQILAKN